jgi:glycosyltransferase involved in cell wall biosynthesis
MTSRRPLVSVVIPCYNAAAFLQETLESVFAQTYPSLEIIAIDDGSTDSTRAVIEACGERISAIYGPNRGAAAARNTATGAASGEYIQYLDADDLLAPHAIASRVDALEESSGSIAYSDWQPIQETDAGVFETAAAVTRALEEVHPDPEIALFSTFWSPPAALLYRRSIVTSIGGWKQHLAPIEDARFALDAALAGGRFVHVPGIGAYYRVFHAPSHSRRDPRAFVRAVLRNAIEVDEIWRARGRLDSGRAKALANCYDYVARSLFRHDRELFRLALQRLYSAEPGFRPSWPKGAGAAQALLGHGATLRALAMIGRPAP